MIFIFQILFLSWHILLILGHSNYHDLQYDEIEKLGKGLNGPFASVKTAFELYKVPHAKMNTLSCSPSVIRISHQESLKKDIYRPQVLISGEIHGDERVGPVASINIAQLLVWSANCEINRDKNSCVQLSNQYDELSNKQRKWLAFLASRRDILVVPTANCLGHKLMRRDDAFVDPNRDFAYGRSNNRCFRSTTANIFVQLMKSNIIQLVVTFHGGMVALGYEWGSTNHLAPKDTSPDHLAHMNIGQHMKHYASLIPGEGAYQTGRINSLVYPVEGGMEDWMYAAGWDPKELANCGNNNPHHLNLRRQLSEDSSNILSGNRALVFLVETSNRKNPNNLGTTLNVLDPKSSGNGHIPRNIRLGLLGIDMIQPYICYEHIQVLRSNTLSLKWYIGGASTIDITFLALHQIPKKIKKDFVWSEYLTALSSSKLLDPLISPANNTNTAVNLPLLMGQVMSGKGRWHGHTSHENTNNNNSHSNDPLDLHPSFNALISFENIPNGIYWLISWAKVDQQFSQIGQGYPTNLGPQSYYSNLRTSEEVHCDPSMNPTCQGFIYWPSDYIEIEVEHGKIKHISQVENCAWWSRTSFTPTNVRIMSESSSTIDPTTSITIHNFEIIYTLFILFFILLIFFSYYLISYWRNRIRIQQSVSSNKFLNLPTGFRN